MKLKSQKLSKNKNQTKKQLVKIIFTWLSLGFILGGWVVGGSLAANQLKYHFQTSIELSGGYQTYFKDYDFSQKNTSFQQPANGDIKQSLPLMQHKIDPLNQKNFQYSYVGNHGASLIVPKSAFNSIDDLNLQVNRIGSMFITDAQGKDLLVETKSDLHASRPFERKSISDYFTGTIKPTLNNLVDRKPIVALGIKPAWSKLVKKQTGIHIWNDIGGVINQMRNDWQDNYRFRKIYEAFNNRFHEIQTEYGNYPQLVNQVKGLFDYTTRSAASYNMLEHYSVITGDTQGRKELFTSLTWKQNANQFYINPFTSKATAGEQPIIALEPVVSKIYDSFTSDADQSHYQLYLVNWENIDQKLPLKVKNNFLQIRTTTQTKSIILASLLRSGVSNHVFRVYAYNEVSASFTQPFLKTTLAIIGMLSVGLIMYLISYFRAMAVIVVTGLGFSLSLTLFLTSLIGLPFSPISIVVLLTTTSAIGSGLVMALRRYRFERLHNKLADLVAFKIVLRQVIPYLLSGTIIFLILALIFYWVTNGAVKAAATLAIVNLAIALFGWLGGSLLAFWLLLQTRILVKIKFLAPAKMGPRQWLGQKVKASYRSIKVKKKKQHNLITTKSQLSADDPVSLTQPQASYPKRSRQWLRFSGRFKRSFLMINFLIMMIFLIIGVTLLVTKKANLDRSLRSGTVFYFSQRVWKNRDQDYSAEIDLIHNIARGTKKVNGKVYKFNLKKIHAIFSQGQFRVLRYHNSSFPAILVTTNINNTNQAHIFQSWLGLASIFSSQDVQFGIDWDFLHPTNSIHTIVKIVTACLAGLVVVWLLTSIGYNWGSGLVIVLSSGLATVMTLAIVVSLYFLISIPTLTILVLVWWFALVNNGFVISRARKNLRFYHLPEYKQFFETHYHHAQTLKSLRRFKSFDRWLSRRRHIQLVLLDHPELTRAQAYKLVLQKWLHDPVDPYQRKFQAQYQYRMLRRQYRRFEQQHNFLNQVATRTIKDLMPQFIFLTGFLVLALTILSVFGGTNGFLFSTMIVGVLLVIYYCFTVAILFWVRLESKYSLLKVRLRNWINCHKPSSNEQTVSGINDLKF